MARYGSAGNAKLLVLRVSFFLSEIDNCVTCFYFYYTFNKYTMFLKFFGKIIFRSGPAQYQSRRGVMLQEVEYIASAPCG